MHARRVVWLLTATAVPVLGLLGCKKPPPDFMALMQQMTQDAWVASRSQQLGQHYSLGNTYLPDWRQPPFTVTRVELEEQVGAVPDVNLPIVRTVGTKYLVVHYVWTGSKWRRTKVELLEQSPCPLPSWLH
jgi:hypothetical protein